MNEPANPFHQDFYGVTTLHPLGVAAVVILGTAMLFVPRRFAVWPMLAMACFVSPAQRLVLGPFDFNLLRIMLVFGTLRVLITGEWAGLRWRSLDWAVVVFAVANLAFTMLRVGPDMLVNRLGFIYDVVGMYVLFRVLVRSLDDVRTIALGASLLAFPVAAAFMVEWMTAKNLFAVLGGVPETTMVREGRLRCQGAFAHPILAGLFWASLLPLIVAQWWDGPARRMLAVSAAGASLFIIVACSSASPITGVMFACLGAALFPLRRWMRPIRWAFLFVLIGLHMVMKAPVWHLISRIDIVGGNSGYHRFQLIDGAIRHWHEWWLIGSNIGTEHWGHHTFDVTNTYIVYGLQGGIVLLAIFIGLIALAFRACGKIWRRNAGNRSDLIWSWAIGVALFVHVTSFLVITYFGQITMLWHLQLAVIGSLYAQRLRAGRGAVAPSVRPRPLVPGPRSGGLAAVR